MKMAEGGVGELKTSRDEYETVRGKESNEAKVTESAADTDTFYWKNHGQHIMYFLIYLLDWYILGIAIYEDAMTSPKNDPTIIHYFIMLIISGGPILFLQIFIGQYTQNGCFVFGEMLPLAYGFGFVMVLTAFTKLVIHFHYTCYLLFYLFVSLCNSTSPWVYCYKSFYDVCPGCLSIEDIDLCPTIDNSDEPCFDPSNRMLAAVLFMQTVGMQGNMELVDVWHEDYKMHYLYAVFHGFVTFAILCILSVRSFKNFEATIRISFYLCMICSFAILVCAFTQTGVLFALKEMWSNYTLSGFLNFETWAAAFRRILLALKLAEGGHLIFGSFIRPNDVSPHRSVGLILGFALQLLFLVMYFRLFVGLFMFKINLTMNELNLNSVECIIFVLFPLLLGIQAYGHLFCFIYFLIVCLMSLCSLTLKVVVIEKTITRHFNIATYYSYVRFFISLLALFAMFLIILATQRNHFYLFLALVTKLMVAVVCMQLVIVYFYSLQRFCDDVEFYYHSKVATFVKISWIMSTVLCFIELQVTIEASLMDSVIVLWSFITVYSSPIFLGFLYQTIVLARKKNLIGLLRPMDEFGPPDIQMRIFRLLYNPRLADKNTQFNQFCTHECLHRSPAIELAIEEEINFLRKLLIELENSEEVDKETFVIKELKQYLKELLKRPKHKFIAVA